MECAHARRVWKSAQKCVEIEGGLEHLILNTLTTNAESKVNPFAASLLWAFALDRHPRDIRTAVASVTRMQKSSVSPTLSLAARPEGFTQIGFQRQHSDRSARRRRALGAGI